MAAKSVTLNDLVGYSPVAGLIMCNPSNICEEFYTISTDSVLARFLCISRASCYIRSRHKTSIPPNVYSELGRKICECDLVYFVNIDSNRSSLICYYQNCHHSEEKNEALRSRIFRRRTLVTVFHHCSGSQTHIYTEFRRQLKSYLFKQPFDC